MVPPQEVESRLKYSPYIRDAWVIAGLGCDSLSAVIVVDAANTGHWADARRVSYTTFGDLSQQPEVYQLIEQEIALVNKVLPEAQRITRYVNLHKEFDPDESRADPQPQAAQADARRQVPGSGQGPGRRPVGGRGRDRDHLSGRARRQAEDECEDRDHRAG